MTVSSSDTFAVIAAGGTGTRMGASVPKQFLEVGGVPIIVRTVRAFDACEEIKGIVVCVPEDCVIKTKQLLVSFGCADKAGVFPGGSNRHETVAAGLNALTEHFGSREDSIILTHDAVRPFVSKRVILENIKAAREYGAANTVIASTDTVLVSKDGLFISSVPDRRELYRVQTPQTFTAGKLNELLQGLTPENAARYTDTAALFSERGYPVRLVRGDEENIKITTPFDLAVAEAFLSGNGVQPV